MEKFYPERVFIEKRALDYPLGSSLHSRFSEDGLPVNMIDNHNRLPEKPDLPPPEIFERAKRTLVVGVKKTLTFQSCQPSADYRLVTGTSCPGKCEYCYLASSLGPAVYIRAYVNLDEILQAARRHIERGLPQVTTFEASSSSDPVAVEHLTGALGRMIPFFATQKAARLRLVTKFAAVDSLLDLEHGGHTRFRFSVNTRAVIDRFENNTSPLDHRIRAAEKVMEAGFPAGFLVAPLMVYEGWEDDYRHLIRTMHDVLGGTGEDMTFELISHRFTTRARRIIEERFPDTDLVMDTGDREHRGFGKYVYREDVRERLEDVVTQAIEDHFPHSRIEYFV